MGIDFSLWREVNSIMREEAETLLVNRVQMGRWVVAFAALVVAGAACPSPAGAQAAASYAIAASKSTAMGAAAKPLTPKAPPLVTPKASPLAKRNLSRTAPTLGDVMGQNRQKLEAKGGPSAGSLHVESLPGKATVSVDGSPVAYTPADLKLPEGNHVVELTLPGYTSWRKEINMSREGTMLLKGELRTEYKSAVNFSRFQ